MRNSFGRSSVVIILSVAIVALVLRIAIEQLMKANLAQNESLAQSTLKLISTALENYAKDRQNSFPDKFLALTQTQPAYLDKDYLAKSPIKGYSYSCARLDFSGYNCSAIPVKCGLTGKMVFNVSTGGLFISEECNKKE